MIHSVRNIDFDMKGPAALHGRELEACAAAYYRHLPAIADYIYACVRGIYPGLERRGLEAKLGRPLIDAQSGAVIYSRHSLGGDHAFSFRAFDDFRLLRGFSIDGRPAGIFRAAGSGT